MRRVMKYIIMGGGLLGVLFGNALIISAMWTYNQHNEQIGYDLLIVGLLVLK